MRRTLRALATITLLTTLLEYPAHPGRVGARLDSYAQGLLLRVEASPEGFGGSVQSTYFHNLAAFGVDEAQVGVFVSEVQSGCHCWLVAATMHF